jgi:hypothetical protein
VRLIETFDLYKRLVTEMERARAQATKHFEDLNPSAEAKATVLLGMLPGDVFEEKKLSLTQF